MKLFAFVRRARRQAPTSPAPAAAAPEDAAATATTTAEPTEKRRRRPSRSSSSGSAAWKPTLGAISEDAAVTAAALAKAQAKPAAKAKAARSPRRATRAAASYDDFRCMYLLLFLQALRAAYGAAGVLADGVPVLSSGDLRTATAAARNRRWG
ncbi:hypothetical protein SEVIR_2G354500v4 [Setaria viridis]